MKWIWVIILAVIGVLAAIVAIEWLTVPIHSLPSFIGGKHIRGHYKRRGEALALVAVVALGGAVYLAVRFRREGQPSTPAGQAASEPQSGSADSVLSEPASAPDAPMTAPDVPIDNT